MLLVCCAGRCLHTTQNHTDYVTCLAASPAAGKLVSAGLRSEVILYDMHVSAQAAENDDCPERPAAVEAAACSCCTQTAVIPPTLLTALEATREQHSSLLGICRCLMSCP